MRIILDATEKDDQPSVTALRSCFAHLQTKDGLIIGVNDAGHGNVLIERLRQAGIPCERWFRASCGLRKKDD